MIISGRETLGGLERNIKTHSEDSRDALAGMAPQERQLQTPGEEGEYVVAEDFYWYPVMSISEIKAFI